jgi:stage II sporulation protein D
LIYPDEKKEDIIRLYDINQDKIVEINENEYISGVVAAEMPAEFEIEALKAQALCARTYLKSKNGCDKANNADICNDYSHCQAYKSKDELKDIWKKDYEKNYKKIFDACQSVNDKIIVYNNEPISAVFHSTSSGKTENGIDVWGGDAPYLKSVDSSYDKKSPKFKSSKTISIDEFKEKLSCDSDDIYSSIGKTTITEGGGVKSIEIGDKVYSGRDIREMFDLNSTNFTLDIFDSSVVFNVSGYGHGVGMSQYGANFMAKDGNNYVEIIKHYYRGVDITKNK